jgi:hypothetical protein
VGEIEAVKAALETGHPTEDLLSHLTWDDVVQALTKLALERGEWAGIPLPIQGMSMRIAERYPYKELEQVFMPEEPATRVCRDGEVTETVALRNRWFSPSRRVTFSLYQVGARVRLLTEPAGPGSQARMLLDTLGASRAWDLDAEILALDKLQELVSDVAFRYYVLTGMFLEQSRRSGVTYLFRRLRPTLALSTSTGEAVVLAALCLHSVAYYTGTWAGALCPTDDVISHLVLMRGDEAKFWRYAEQHQPLDPAAGIL